MAASSRRKPAARGEAARVRGKATNPTANALLEAHVQHELDGLRGEAFGRFVETELSALFDWLATVTLNDVSSRDQIVGVIERRAIEIRVSGGITELAGEMANKVFTSARNEHTRLDQIVGSRAFEDIIDKVVGLEQAKHQIIHSVTQSTAYRTAISRVLQRAVLDFAFGVREPVETRGLSLLAHVGRRVARRLIPDLERTVARRLSRHLDRNADQIARGGEEVLLDALDATTIRRTADEIWADLAPMRLSDIFAHIGSYDLEDFVVIGHEFWLKFRKTEYFHEIMRGLVDHFFDKYGEQSLVALIDDMGVSKDMVVTEVRLQGAPVIVKALETGFLERLIRAHLEPFYASDRVKAILGV